MIVSFFIVLFFVLIFIIILLNLFLTNSVILPASRLRNAMRRMQEGDPGVGIQVNFSSLDEIGQMASAFNEMSERLSRQHLELTDAIAAKDSYSMRLRQSNQELEQLNVNLENMVQERTLELSRSNRQLQEEIYERQRAYNERQREYNERQRISREKEELEKRLVRSKKMEALGLLAGGVAHDLNNVLSGIVSYPDLLLLDLSEDHPMYKPVITIKESGQKAAAIVQDLLTLARRGVITNEVVNLNTILSEYFMSPEHNKIQMYHSNIFIETHLQKDLLNIKGSSLHLKKTIMNLISNAAEAQPDGGRIIVSTYNRYMDTPVSRYEDVEEGDYAVLEVKDYGVGISEKDHERIFEPFYTKKNMGRSGTGLGMAVVWGTMQDHHGYINIESKTDQTGKTDQTDQIDQADQTDQTDQTDKGTTFELYFPVTRQSVDKEFEVPVLSTHMGNNETVMIIDDVVEQIEIATVILKKLGYNPVSASSGEEAVTYLKSRSVDIMMLDMVMDPGMDGLDTYKKILEIHPEQKAVIVSGYAENDRVKELQRLGAGVYIKKPYTIAKIGKVIKEELLKTYYK